MTGRVRRWATAARSSQPAPCATYRPLCWVPYVALIGFWACNFAAGVVSSVAILQFHASSAAGEERRVARLLESALGDLGAAGMVLVAAVYVCARYAGAGRLGLLPGRVAGVRRGAAATAALAAVVAFGLSVFIGAGLTHLLMDALPVAGRLARADELAAGRRARQRHAGRRRGGADVHRGAGRAGDRGRCPAAAGRGGQRGTAAQLPSVLRLAGCAAVGAGVGAAAVVGLSAVPGDLAPDRRARFIPRAGHRGQQPRHSGERRDGLAASADHGRGRGVRGRRLRPVAAPTSSRRPLPRPRRRCPRRNAANWSGSTSSSSGRWWSSPGSTTRPAPSYADGWPPPGSRSANAPPAATANVSTQGCGARSTSTRNGPPRRSPRSTTPRCRSCSAPCNDQGIPVRTARPRRGRTQPDDYRLLVTLYADPDITALLRRHRIPRRPRPGPIAERFPTPASITDQLLRDAYLDIGLSAGHTALLTGQPAGQILDQLHAAGIPVRTSHGAALAVAGPTARAALTRPDPWRLPARTASGPSQYVGPIAGMAGAACHCWVRGLPSPETRAFGWSPGSSRCTYSPL